ncbi:MAG: energy transducer TonB [Planctomycetes bacterium]|nr:energy transducer TonB [Planctomycetota bacterium]
MRAQRKKDKPLLVIAIMGVMINVLLIFTLPLLNQLSAGQDEDIYQVRPLEIIRPHLTEIFEPEEIIPVEEAEPVKDAVNHLPEPPMPVVAMPTPSLDYNTNIQISLPLTYENIDLSATAIKTAPINPDQFYQISELDQAPKVMRRVQPPYPAMAYRMGLEGEFRVTFIVEKDGAIREPKIISKPEGVGDVFDLTILKTLSKWQMQAGMKNGVAVKSRVENSFVFQLD